MGCGNSQKTKKWEYDVAEFLSLPVANCILAEILFFSAGKVGLTVPHYDLSDASN